LEKSVIWDFHFFNIAMTPFNSYLYLSNDNELPEDGLDSAADIFPTIEESSFCSNFQCCGRSLKDLHELLQHYEESHVRIEDGEDEAFSAGMFDFDTVIAADSLLNVGANASSRSNSVKADSSSSAVSSGSNLMPSPYSVSSNDSDRSKRQSPHSKRPRILTLGIEPCDYANDDSEHLSAFDNTVIRPVDPYRMYNNYNGHHGYARIAPKRSHSVPALPNFPLINGENGFKLIHSILSSTADPPSAENSSFQSIGYPSCNGISVSNFPSSTSSGYPNAGYSLSRSGNDRPFVCPVSGCGKTYKNANGLKYHAIHGHDGVLVEKPHKCPFNGCGKRYKNSNGLKYHFQHAHPNTPPPSGLAMTGPGNSYPSHSSYSRPQSFAAHSYSTSLAASSQAPPPRPHSTVSASVLVPTFNRMAPPAAALSNSTSPSIVTTSGSSGNNTTVHTLSSETIQNLLATAPAAIANLLKKNPNLKQHLPTIIRNLQQIALQKSNNTSTQSYEQERKHLSANNSEADFNRQENISKNN
jgi:hypothetical protein